MQPPPHTIKSWLCLDLGCTETKFVFSLALAKERVYLKTQNNDDRAVR